MAKLDELIAELVGRPQGGRALRFGGKKSSAASATATSAGSSSEASSDSARANLK
jgi:hypothetical protein